MEVIGAGFGRTGTKSLQEALEILGYNKCYHMVSLFSNPHEIKHWEDAASGKQVNWNELFMGCKSVVDFPGSLYYKELMEQYPDAKVILTVRSAESWYKSTFSTIYSFNPGRLTKLKLIATAPFVKRSRNLIRIVKMNQQTIWKTLFHGRFEDKSYAINIFNQHIEEVKLHVPADKLLIFEAREGWEPLCKFLGCPVPAASYPGSNSSEDFHKMTKNFLSITQS